MSHSEAMSAKSPLRLAMEARDLDAIVAAFAPDAEFISPLTASYVFKGRNEIEAVSKVVLEVFKGFHYTQELMDDQTGYLVSRAKVDGMDIEMVDSIRFRPDGKIQTLTVFFRPLPAAAAALRRIGAAFGRRKSPVRGALIAALTTPLALMTRLGDGVGVRLLRSTL